MEEKEKHKEFKYESYMGVYVFKSWVEKEWKRESVTELKKWVHTTYYYSARLELITRKFPLNKRDGGKYRRWKLLYNVQVQDFPSRMTVVREHFQTLSLSCR